MIVDLFSIARSLSCLNQVNHCHGLLSLSLVTLTFEHVWNRSTHIQALHLGPLTPTFNWSQFDVADNIVPNNVLFDFIMMSLHYSVCVSA